MDGIPNSSLIESAIARPYSGYYPKIAEKAAALVQSMAGNHGFADGNKRTTLILVHLMLKKSDYELMELETDASLDLAAEQMVLDSVNREIDFNQLVDWFTRRIWRMP